MMAVQLFSVRCVWCGADNMCCVMVTVWWGSGCDSVGVVTHSAVQRSVPRLLLLCQPASPCRPS